MRTIKAWKASTRVRHASPIHSQIPDPDKVSQVRKQPWNYLSKLKNLYRQSFAILQILGILLAICTTCTLPGFIRKIRFSIMVDR